MSRSPELMTERPSLPGIHDLFGEHLALPINRSSPFAFNITNSSLPIKTSRSRYGYESREPNIALLKRSDREQAAFPICHKGRQGANKELSNVYTNGTRVSTIVAQRYSSSQPRNYREQDNCSPPSTGSGDEPFEAAPERKKLPAKYECEYCGKCFNRPSSLKIHHNTHTGQKPFSCVFPGCGRSFSVMSNMRRHARTHGDSAVLLTREQSDSELSGIQLTPAPGIHPSTSGPNSRGSSRSATPLSYQSSRVPSRTLLSRERSGSFSSDSSL